MISNVKMIVQEINFVHIGWLDPQAELRLQLVDSPSLCPPIFWFGCYSGLTAPVILHLYPAARSLSTNKNWGESLDTILLSGWRTKTFLVGVWLNCHKYCWTTPWQLRLYQKFYCSGLVQFQFLFSTILKCDESLAVVVQQQWNI